jgi:hypothetical protein
MTTHTSDWSREARERRRYFKAEGLSPKHASQIVRAERIVRQRLAAVIGKSAAAKARLAYIEGDPQPIKMMLDNCHLDNEQRLAIAPLCSGYAVHTY